MANGVTDGSEKGRSSGTASEESPRAYSPLRWAMVLSAIYSTQFLYGLDNTIVADIQAYVIEDLGDIEKLGWLGIGFPLGGVSMILALGKAYSLFDNKWLYFASLIMFTAGSALCGAAPEMNALIAGRIWAGAGGAGMYLGVLNLIAVHTTTTERPIYMAVSGLVWGAGTILGPVVGGAFSSSSATWRWAFYINLPLFALFGPICIFILRPYSFQPDNSRAKKLLTIDWVGIALNATAWTLLVVSLTLAGITWTWNDGRTIALLVISAVVLLVFITSQYLALWTTKANRLFPGDFLRSRTTVLLFICQSSMATLLYLPIYYIPLYFQSAKGDSGKRSVVRLLPYICVALAANMAQGVLSPRFGYYSPWYAASGVCGVVGAALLHTCVDVDTPARAIYGVSIVLAIGSGLSQTTGYSVALAKVAPHRFADAVCFINVAHIGGVTLALTGASSAFQAVGFRRTAEALAGLDFTRAEVQSALMGQRSQILLEVSEQVRSRVIAGVVRTIGDVYIFAIVASVLCFVGAALMRREKLFFRPAPSN